jgi:PKD repeat protein
MKSTLYTKLAVLLIVVFALGGCRPQVQITSPADGASFSAGQEITFSATATDFLAANLSDDLFIWKIDGVEAGRGKTIKKSDLAAGTHTITLTVLDMHGRGDGMSEISITITGGSVTTTTVPSTTTAAATTTAPATTTASATTTAAATTTAPSTTTAPAITTSIPNQTTTSTVNAGNCANPAFITKDDLAAARAAINAGGTDIALNSDGCIRLLLTRDNSTAIKKAQIVYAGQVFEESDLSNMPAEGIVKKDFDLDGFFEFELTAANSATITEQMAVLISYNTGSSHYILERVTLSRTEENSVHIVVEVDDGSGTGTLIIQSEYDEAMWGSASRSRNSLNFLGWGEITVTNCTAAQESQIRTAMDQVLGQGAQCMDNFASAGAFRMGNAFLGGINISCGTPATNSLISPDSCMVNSVFDFILTGRTTILVNTDNTFVDPKCSNLNNLLLHEMMHSAFSNGPLEYLQWGRHSDESENAELNDRVYACAATCFGPKNGGIATKCNCAVCNQSNKCAPECAGYAECSAASCPCDSKNYPDEATCNVVCPSSNIGCSFTSCSPAFTCP